jgi:hemerythrin superfamily protein
MNAIDMLESQHREVEELFSKFEKARQTAKKEELFTKIADSLAIHASIEEHHFYPAVRDRRTEDILLESLEEHLGIKRILNDLLDLAADDDTFDAKIAVLKEEVQHHVKEEEGTLFPKVRKLFDKAELEGLGDEMAAEQAELEDKGNPREAIPGEVERAATL